MIKGVREGYCGYSINNYDSNWQTVVSKELVNACFATISPIQVIDKEWTTVLWFTLFTLLALLKRGPFPLSLSPYIHVYCIIICTIVLKFADMDKHLINLIAASTWIKERKIKFKNILLTSCSSLSFLQVNTGTSL